MGASPRTLVYVRLGPGLREAYNAGEKDDHARYRSERWPHSRRRRAGNVHPDYGGVVYVDEEQPTYIPTGRFSAVWASASDEWLEEAEDFEDVETAVDWGRARAPLVLVAELPSSYFGVPTYPTYEIRSAGDEDPPGDPLERLRPRLGQETMAWSFATHEAVSDIEPDMFSRRLEEALRRDDTVSDPVCRVRDDEPGFWSRPAFVAAEGAEGTVMAQPPPIRGWVDVSVRVSAPTRKRAFELALAALHRTRDTGGETAQSFFIGHFTLHAVN